MKKRILIVDDDRNALRLMSQALELEGYETIIADNGPEALTAAERERPDLIVLDVVMPGMSGIDACSSLRSGAHTAQIPILMLSGRGKVEDKVAGLRGGADDYVAKPVDTAELVARVEALILRASRALPASAPGHVLALVGSKGGVGTTTVAVNLALALVQLGKAVVLVDLHPYLGCVCPMLGLGSTQGLRELAQMEAQSINPRDLQKRLTSHPSGLRVLGGDESLPAMDERELGAPQVQSIVEGLTTLADWVLLDLPVQFTAATQAALDRCDLAALVTEPDPIALRCAKGQLALLEQCGIAREQARVVVVNRTPLTMTMTVNQLQDRLGTAIVGVVPPASEASFQAQQRGLPLLLADTHGFAAEVLRSMAQGLVGVRA